ncbi:MAG: hypothetical protein ACT4PP_03490 [Sporichthyaceae bacterium]
MERIGLMRASTSYRFSVRFAIILGVLGFTFCALVDELAIGIFICIGLALGWLNTAMIVRATARFAESGEASKKGYIGGVFQRLALITAIAMVIMLAYQPEGLAVLFGIAFFQFTIIGSSAGVLFREVRQG